MPDDSSAVTWAAGVPVVTAPLEIDVGNAGDLRAGILTAIDAGRDVVITDMSETAFCDSTGLNVLVRAHKQLSANSRELQLVIREPALLTPWPRPRRRRTPRSRHGRRPRLRCRRA